MFLFRQKYAINLIIGNLYFDGSYGYFLVNERISNILQFFI